MAKLYELTEKYAELQKMIEDGVDPEALADTLEALEGAIEEKVEAIYRLRQNLQADIEALKAEEKRLADKRKSLEAQVERLKEYVERELEAAGIDKIKTTIGTVGFRKAPASVEILDVGKIPMEFLIPQDPKVDRRGLLNAFKNRTDVNPAEMGFIIIDGKRTLQFR